MNASASLCPVLFAVLLCVVACSNTPEPSPAEPREAGAGEPPAAASTDAGMSTDAEAGPAPAESFAVWRQKQPIYELYVRHFSPSGDFKGVEARLPELEALGVGILWLLPVNEIGSIDRIDAPHGNPYAVRSYERVNPEYGTDADLKSLVASAHKRGMHVIVDWVPNHTAWDNPMIVTHPDWYAHENGAVKPVGEFPWIAQLDWSNPDLREYMSNVMVSWLQRFDIDGFRIDYAHSMPVEFFTQLRPRLEKVRPVFLLAEAGDARFHPAFDMTYDWNVYPLFGEIASGAKPVSALDDALLHTQLVPYASMPEGLVMRMTYNHDDNGKFTLAARYGGGIKTFAVLACTLPGKPLVFDGQEVGMNVFDGQTVRPSINLGHDPAVKIDWADPDGYRPFYTKVLKLFQANRALHHAGMSDFRKIDTVPSQPAYAFVRRDGDHTVLVIANLSATELPSVVLAPAPNAGAIGGDYVELFTDQPERIAAGQSVHLPPWAYRVYVQGPLR